MLKKIMSVMLAIGIMLTFAASASAAVPSMQLATTIPSQVTEGKAAIGMCANESYAFVNYGDWIEVYDIASNPVQPVYLTEIEASFTNDGQKLMKIDAIQLEGNYLFAACYSKSANTVDARYLAVYDISEITQDAYLTPVATTSKSQASATKEAEGIPGLSAQAFNFGVKDGVAVTVSATNGMYWFDVSEEAIAEAAANDTYLPRIHAVAHADILANKKTDVTAVGRYSTIRVDGEYVYYTAWNYWDLELFSARRTDTGIDVIGTYALGDYTSGDTTPSVSDIYVDGDYVLVPTMMRRDQKITGTNTQDTNGLFILDVSEVKANGTPDAPVTPRLVEKLVPEPSGLTISTSQMGGMKVDGNNLYIWGSGSKWQKIFMYDITDMENPVLLTQTGKLTTTGRAMDALHSIAVQNGYIYSCAYTNGLVVHRSSDLVISDVTVTKGSAVLEALEPGDLEISMVAENYTAEALTAHVILALYYQDELETIVIKEQTVGTEGGELTASISVPAADGYRLKIMVWDDLDNMNIKSVTWDGDSAVSTGLELTKASQN